MLRGWRRGGEGDRVGEEGGHGRGRRDLEVLSDSPEVMRLVFGPQSLKQLIPLSPGVEKTACLPPASGVLEKPRLSPMCVCDSSLKRRKTHQHGSLPSVLCFLIRLP